MWGLPVFSLHTSVLPEAKKRKQATGYCPSYCPTRASRHHGHSFAKHASCNKQTWISWTILCSPIFLRCSTMGSLEMHVNFTNGEVNQLTADQFQCINREHTSGLPRSSKGTEKNVSHIRKNVLLLINWFPFFCWFKRFSMFLMLISFSFFQWRVVSFKDACRSHIAERAGRGNH